MAAQYCTTCGKPLPSGALFCVGCRSAVGGGASSTPSMGPPGAGALDLPSLGGPPLGAVLGLDGSRNFLLHHQLVSAGRNYRVLNHEQRHLFTVKEDVRQEFPENFLGRMGPQETGFHVGRVALGTRTFSGTVADSGGNLRATIAIQLRGNSAVSTLAD